MADPRAIGVFDSGVGGLTVLHALRRALPHEALIYLGDTARLPYGTKSAGTVARYALQAADLLLERGVKLLVVACNTASAVAIEGLTSHCRTTPVLGVVEPGAAAAVRASASGRIAVIGTEGTIRGGAYERAIVRLRPDARVHGVACPLFVALAEEGWVDGDVPELAARRYLEPLFSAPVVERPDCLVLGCTHFPVLRGVLERVVGEGVAFVDSAATTAKAVVDELERSGLRAPPRETAAPTAFLATDASERFVRVGPTFFGGAISTDEVEWVDLGRSP